MMNTILFDGPVRNQLLPFTFTRPVAEIRVGILTIREKWEQRLDRKTSTKTEDYLSEKWPLHQEDTNLFINASFLPNEILCEEILALKKGECLMTGDSTIAFVSQDFDQENLIPKTSHAKALHIQSSHDIFSKNPEAIQEDFDFMTQGRTSAEIPAQVFTKNKEQIFIEPGATLTNCSLNAEGGPIYIAKDAEVMEGALIRGPFVLCEHAYVNMGAKMYGGSTIGPYSKVGGEIHNSVIFGYSNKGHDGFLGNSVLGEWCNLGADTNNSNLKNNYASVRLWDYETERFADTQLQFCGLMMGDHSKSGINTMFNTGTVVGVSANVFGAGFPRNFVPSFTWGGSAKMITYRLDKVFEVAEKVMARRKVELTNQDKTILEKVFDMTQKYRRD